MMHTYYLSGTKVFEVFEQNCRIILAGKDIVNTVGVVNAVGLVYGVDAVAHIYSIGLVWCPLKKVVSFFNLRLWQ